MLYGTNPCNSHIDRPRGDARNRHGIAGVLKMRHFIWLAGLVMGVVAAGSAWAASFDCAKAKSKLEVLVCSTPALNAADEAMGQAYQAANAGFPIKGFVRASQAVFLGEYRACASDRAKDKGAAACTALALRRTQELQELLSDTIYADGITSYTPEDALLLVGERNGQAYLKIFGSWMPDAYRPKPFPDGFICNEEFALVREASGFVLGVVGDLSRAAFQCPGQPAPTASVRRPYSRSSG
jgi:uncharacterized protein YecT (DUF1311 family)